MDKLVYVNYMGKNSSDVYENEFYFSEKPEQIWMSDWGEDNPSACEKENLTPYKTFCSTIKKLHTIIPLSCAQDNRCFSMQHVMDKVLAVAWEDISEYEEYPEPIRLVFHYGESIIDIENKLSQRNQLFCDDE